MSLKLLLDEDVSPRVAIELSQLGYDAVHLHDIGLKGCKDSQIIAYDRDTGRCRSPLEKGVLVVSNSQRYRVRLTKETLRE